MFFRIFWKLTGHQFDGAQNMVFFRGLWTHSHHAWQSVSKPLPMAGLSFTRSPPFVAVIQSLEAASLIRNSKSPATRNRRNVQREKPCEPQTAESRDLLECLRLKSWWGLATSNSRDLSNTETNSKGSAVNPNYPQLIESNSSILSQITNYKGLPAMLVGL